MKKLLLLIVFFGVYKLQAANLQLDLESTYKNYVDAIHSNDIEKIKSTMSTHGFVNLKNLIVSSKLKFPEDFILTASQDLINLKKEKYITAQEKANTANCIYYGKGFNYTKALIVISFIKEGEQWKYDNISEKSSDEIINKMESKDFSFLNNNKDFMPTGSAPAAMKEIPSIDYKALFNLQVEGYKVSLKINNVPQDINNSTMLDAVVMGGVKKGINYIEVKLTPIYQAEKNSFKLSIKATLKSSEKEVLHIQEDKPSIMFTKEFEIN